MKKRKILIFGNGPSAEVVFKILKKIEKFKFIGFTVDKKFIDKKKIFGYPVFDFKYLVKKFPKKNMIFYFCWLFKYEFKQRKNL